MADPAPRWCDDQWHTPLVEVSRNKDSLAWYSIRREGKPDYLRTVSVEFTSMDVDPELLSILIGQPKPDFAIEIHAPVKRTFWQWLRRKPPLWNHWYVPNVKMGEVDDQADD